MEDDANFWVSLVAPFMTTVFDQDLLYRDEGYVPSCGLDVLQPEHETSERLSITQSSGK